MTPLQKTVALRALRCAFLLMLLVSPLLAVSPGARESRDAQAG